MQHVRQIEDLFDRGQTSEAHEALDLLLSFGPSNTAALKLRARLFQFEGRFAEEHKVWETVANIDNEDEDAVDYLLQKQLEDSDMFYFTDDLAGGGRRFLARSTALTHSILITTMSCMIFVLLTARVQQMPAFFQDPLVIIFNFGLMAAFPSFYTFYLYLRSLKTVSVTRTHLELATPVKRTKVVWEDVEKVCLARSIKGEHTHLSLVIVPKNRHESIIEIDMNPHSAAVRARTYLVREIARIFGEPEYVKREDLGLAHFRVTSY